jgi:UDP-N-acetylmuramate--alanine ligase
MSALAKCCMLWGIKVSGYDRQSSAITDELRAAGAYVHFDDDPEELRGYPDLVIYTPAIPETSRLKHHFFRFNVPMIKRSQALEIVTKGVDTVAVAGTHGKTTTSSMISYLLTSTEHPHTALLGGIAANYHSNFYSEGLEMMVVEADEYDRSFTVISKMGSGDRDGCRSLDIYSNYESMLLGYRQFIRQIESGGLLLYRVIKSDREEVMDALKRRK